MINIKETTEINGKNKKITLLQKNQSSKNKMLKRKKKGKKLNKM